MNTNKTNKNTGGLFGAVIVLILAHVITQWFERLLGLGLQ